MTIICCPAFGKRTKENMVRRRVVGRNVRLKILNIFRFGSTSTHLHSNSYITSIVNCKRMENVRITKCYRKLQYYANVWSTRIDFHQNNWMLFLRSTTSLEVSRFVEFFGARISDGIADKRQHFDVNTIIITSL